MYLYYDTMALDFQPSVLARVVHSSEPNKGSGTGREWLDENHWLGDDGLVHRSDDSMLPDGNYSTIWPVIEEYLQNKYSKQREYTIASLYRLDREERLKATKRAREDGLKAALAAKGLTLEQYKAMPSHVRQLMGLTVRRRTNKVKKDRRAKTKPVESAKIGLNTEAERRAAYDAATALLREYRSEITDDTGKTELDYMLDDT